MKPNEYGASSMALPKIAIRRGFQADELLIGYRRHRTLWEGCFRSCLLLEEG